MSNSIIPALLLTRCTCTRSSSESIKLHSNVLMDCGLLSISNAHCLQNFPKHA